MIKFEDIGVAQFEGMIAKRHYPDAMPADYTAEWLNLQTTELIHDMLAWKGIWGLRTWANEIKSFYLQNPAALELEAWLNFTHRLDSAIAPTLDYFNINYKLNGNNAKEYHLQQMRRGMPAGAGAEQHMG